MHRLFEGSRLQAEFSDYPYNHSAHFLELLRLHPLAAQLPRGHYLSFLEGSFSANCGFGSRRTRESSGREFERRGESVFEMRFQRHLQEHGYWFERNVRIGLSEYDIVVKGRLSEEFRPFAACTHPQEVDREQLALFQKMTSLWSIDRKQRRSSPLVVSLNGPYHFVQGDRQGLTRSEEVKSRLLEYYGYAEGRTVDYREWERETTNQEAVKQFLQRLLK